MIELQYGLGAYRRTEGALPELKLLNMWVEPAPPSERGVVLQSRPALVADSTVGDGPIRGIFQKDGVFDGDTFTVSDNELYRGETLLGTITGTGPVSFAASSSELLVAAGASAHSYNGTNLAAVVFPDSANVTAVGFLAGFFIYLRAGGHRFYWSALNDGRTIDALDFASAENAPDQLVDIAIIQDEAYLCGTDTIEPWQPTGDSDLPFIRSRGRLYRKGVIGTGCAREVDNTLYFITNEKTVCRIADVPQKVSHNGIDERLAASTTFLAFHFLYRGHEFFAIRYNGGGTLANGDIQEAGTHAFDVATGQWCEFGSFGEDNFLAQCAETIDGEPLFGSAEDGSLYEFSGHDENDGPVIKWFTAAVPLAGPQIFSNIVLMGNSGQTPYLDGSDADPVIEIRGSEDAGLTFDEWQEAELGAQGEYATRVIWRAMGLYADPGAVFEIRSSARVGLRVSAMKANMPLGGRGR